MVAGWVLYILGSVSLSMAYGQLTFNAPSANNQSEESPFNTGGVVGDDTDNDNDNDTGPAPLSFPGGTVVDSSATVE